MRWDKVACWKETHLWMEMEKRDHDKLSTEEPFFKKPVKHTVGDHLFMLSAAQPICMNVRSLSKTMWMQMRFPAWELNGGDGGKQSGLPGRSWKSPVSCQKGLSPAAGLGSRIWKASCEPSILLASVRSRECLMYKSPHGCPQADMDQATSLHPNQRQQKVQEANTAGNLALSHLWDCNCTGCQQVQWLSPLCPSEINHSEYVFLENALKYILWGFLGWLVLKKKNKKKGDYMPDKY